MTRGEADELEPGTTIHVVEPVLGMRAMMPATHLVRELAVAAVHGGMVRAGRMRAVFSPGDCFPTRAAALAEAMRRVDDVIDHAHRIRTELRGMADGGGGRR